MTTDTVAAEVELKLIPIEAVLPSGTNPRKTFDPKALEDLTASIKDKGVLQPVLVRFKPRQQVGGTSISEHYELVAGERRWRAAKKAGLTEIPAVIRQLSDDEALEAQVIENLQRADVHPLEEAEGYRTLLKKGRFKIEDLAAKISKSVSYVWQRLKLTELIEPAKKAFLEDKIHAGHAVLIARLQPQDQKEAVQACVQKDDTWNSTSKGSSFVMGVRDLQAWISSNIHLSLDGAPWKKDDAELLPKAGPCTTCPKRAGNAPGLWPEVVRPQTCTDRVCFDGKFTAFMNLRARELRAQGKLVQFITDRWQCKWDKQVWGTEKYKALTKASKKCEWTAIGIFVEGKQKMKEIPICTKHDECKVHKERNAYNSSGRSNAAQKEYEKQRQKELIKERATTRARLAILDAVLLETKTLGRDDLEVLAKSINRLTYFPSWEELQNAPKDLDDSEEFGKASDKDLARFLLAAALNDDLKLHSEAELLYAVAKRHKIDVKAIEKKALEAVVYDRAHKDRMQRWKGLKASANTCFEIMTCQLCGRTEVDQAKGGWHWIRKNDKNKTAVCNDCDRLERK